MSAYEDKMKELSDDMIGQLYLASRKELFSRGINIKALARGQVKTREVIGFYSKEGDPLYGYVTSVNPKTITAVQIDGPNDADVISGLKWKVGGEVVSFGPSKPTMLPKKEVPVKPHVIQTNIDETW